MSKLTASVLLLRWGGSRSGEEQVRCTGLWRPAERGPEKPASLTRLTTPPASRPVRDSPQHLNQGTSSCLHFEHWNKKIDLVTSNWGSEDIGAGGLQTNRNSSDTLDTSAASRVCVWCHSWRCERLGLRSKPHSFPLVVVTCVCFFLFLFVSLLSSFHRPARCFHHFVVQIYKQ